MPREAGERAPSPDPEEEEQRLKWHQKFARQRFQGWRPILNVGSAQIFFVSAGIFCIALGIPILIASLTVTEYSVRYDNQGPFSGERDRDSGSTRQQQLIWGSGGYGVPVTVSFDVVTEMQPPIYVSYRLGSFFQNYRRYVRSYDSGAMHNGPGTGGGASACDPFRYVNNEANASLPNNGAIMPCGQIAYSNFNDSYSLSLTTEDGSTVSLDLDESNLAWESDQKHLYGSVMAQNYNTDPSFRGGNTTNNTLDQSQHWMVWMKPSGTVAVIKLYGVIHQKITAGSKVTVTVVNRYNTYEFGGSKSLILTTNSWVGGKNNFLGAVYVTVGGLSCLVALAFFLAFNAGLVAKRQYGDLAHLSWLRKYDGSLRPTPRLQVQPVQPAGQQHDGSSSEQAPKN